MIFLIIFGFLAIAGIVCGRIFDNEFGNVSAIIGGLSCLVFVSLLIVAVIKNMSYMNDQKRIFLTNQRTAIIEELNQSNHDVLLQGIKDAQEFNIKLESEQYKIKNPWVKIFHSDVYNEFSPIEYNQE